MLSSCRSKYSRINENKLFFNKHNKDGKERQIKIKSILCYLSLTFLILKNFKTILYSKRTEMMH